MTASSKRRAIPFLVATGLALGACGGAAPNSSSTTTSRSGAPSPARVITLKNIQFHPAVVHIRRGDSVTWKWEDAAIGTAHNVTSTGHTHFASSTTKMTGTYTITFNTAGTYAFECTIHPLSMQGKIIVS